MNYNFEYKPYDNKRIQDFEYSDKSIHPYFFEYHRNIISDLEIFNAPLFVSKISRGATCFNDISLKKITKRIFDVKDVTVDKINKNVASNKINVEYTIKNRIKTRLSEESSFKYLFADRLCNLAQIDGNLIGISKNIKKSFISERYFARKFIYVHVFDNLFLYGFNHNVNIFDIKNIVSKTKILNIYKNIYTHKDNPQTNYFKFYFAQNRYDKITNYYKVYGAFKPINKVEYNKIYEATKFNNKIQIYNIYSLKIYNKIANINKIKSLIHIPEFKMTNIHSVYNTIKIPSIYILNVFKINSGKKKENIANNIKIYSGEKKFNFNIGNINKIYSGKRNGKIANIFKYKNDTKKLKHDILYLKMPYGIKYYKFGSYYNNIYSGNKKYLKALKNSNNNFYNKYKKNINVLENILLFKDRKELNILEQMFLYKDSKRIALDENTLFISKVRYGIVINNNTFFSPTKKGISENNSNTFVKLDSKYIYKNDMTLLPFKDNKQIYSDKYNKHLFKDKKKTSYKHDMFLYKGYNNSFYRYDLLLYKGFKEPFLNTNNVFVMLNNVNVMLKTLDILLYKYNKSSYLEKYNNTLYKGFKGFFVKNNFILSKFKKNLCLNTKNYFYYITNKKIFFRDNKFFSHQKRDFIIDNKNMCLCKDSKSFVLLEQKFLYKDSKNLYILAQSHLNKIRKEMFINNTEKSIFKNRYDIWIQNDLFTNKEPKDIFIFEHKFVYKSPKDLFINNKNLHAYKVLYGIIVDKYIHAFKIPKKTIIANHAKFIEKIKKDIYINDVNRFFYKTEKQVLFNYKDYIIYKQKRFVLLNNKNIFTTAPIRKFYLGNNFLTAHKDVYGVKINEELDNLYLMPLNLHLDEGSIGFIADRKKLQIHNVTSLVKNIKNLIKDKTFSIIKDLNKNTFLNSSLIVYPADKKAWIDYHALLLTNMAKTLIRKKGMFLVKDKKNVIMNTKLIPLDIINTQKEAFIQKDIWIKKYIKETDLKYKDIFFIKMPKEVQKYKDIFFIKILKEAQIYKNITINKNIQEAFIKNFKTVIKINHLKYYDNDFFLDRNSYEAHLDNSNVFYFKETRPLDIFSQFFIDKGKKKFDICNHSFDIDKKEKDINLDDYLFVSKNDYEHNMVINEWLEMQRIVYEMEKPVEHHYNWAWVYSPDNPLEPKEDYKGLDELLLPETDVEYETFEKYIFNKTTMVPTNPVEVINDTTFIAKYPIKHPTPDYETVGIVYIDVPSELMYKIFCKYYEIWYANIFKFGNMSMVDSLRLMLDFMYSWIILTYSGTEYLEPALRVFRQIRWFGEKSVMHNARYLVNYERCDLIVDLHDGHFTEINNDIEDGANQTFYINASAGTIVNNASYFSQDAYINIYTDVTVDTQLKFNLAQAGGAVKIYLDGTYTNEITSYSSLITVNIPPGNHTVKIYRPADKNFATCYIGNIKLINGSYTNLQITYDPELTLGNLPLNDVAQKMLQLASLYANQQEAFDKYREGNLAVSELYKELVSYWDLHHEGKIKGKRLTIKET